MSVEPLHHVDLLSFSISDIEENRMPTPDDDSFDSKQALSDMAKYLFQQQDMLPKFDLAVVITKLGEAPLQ